MAADTTVAAANDQIMTREDEHTFWAILGRSTDAEFSALCLFGSAMLGSYDPE